MGGNLKSKIIKSKIIPIFVPKLQNMIKLGEYNILKVVKIVDFGVYLDGGEYWGEILLPKETAPAECKEGDELKVFIYFDSEDRVIATMTTPKAIVGDFALMKVVGTSRVGAFLDWGLRKDLLVPFGNSGKRWLWGVNIWFMFTWIKRRIVLLLPLD